MLLPFCRVRSYRQLLTFSRCWLSAKLNKYDWWTWSVDHLKTVARARRVTICVDVWSKTNLGTSYFWISPRFFDSCSHTSRHVFNITDRSSFSIFSILVDIVGQYRYRYSDCWTRDERDCIDSLYCAVTCWCVWWIFKVFLGVLHN